MRRSWCQSLCFQFELYHYNAVHPALNSGSRLMDYAPFNGGSDNHKRSRNAKAPTDVGVKVGVTLPRGNHRAWVSRIAADQRPSHRYKHMATVARLGARYVVAWQASAVGLLHHSPGGRQIGYLLSSAAVFSRTP